MGFDKGAHEASPDADPATVLLAYVYLYDQRGGGVETSFKGDHQGLGIGINLTKSPSTSVGARVVWSGRVGLYGRPACLFPVLTSRGTRSPPHPRAAIKALPTHPLPTRPYRQPGILSAFLPEVDAYWATIRAWE
jgi:hypothetical protein